MKKLSKIALAVLFAALPLASCNSGGGNNQSGDLSDVDWDAFKSASGPKTTVSLWTTIGQTNQTIFNQIISAFEAEYPGIHIDHTTKGGYDTLFTDIQSAIPAGTTPTMAYCYSDHVATYLDANMAVMDMTPFMNDPEHGFGTDEVEVTTPSGDKVTNRTDKEDMIEGYLEDGHNYVINGEKLDGYYSLPFTRSSEVLVYNKTFFDEHGLDANKLKTWKGVWEISKTIIENGWLTVTDGNHGVEAPLGYDSGDNMFITLSKQLGIPYTTGTDPNPLSFYVYRDQGGKQMTEKLRDYFVSNYFITQDTANGYTSSAFSNQKCFMTISSTAGINYCVPEGTVNADGTEDIPFEVGISPYPTMDDGSFVDGLDINTAQAKTDAVISQGPSICFFSRATMQEKAAAWLFYKFASGSYWNAVWAGETGYEPVRNSSYDEQVFLDRVTPSDTDKQSEKNQKIANGQVHDIVREYGNDDRLYTSDVFVGSAQARLAVGDLLNGVISADVGEGQNLDDIVEDLFYQYFNTAAQALPSA